MVVRHRLRLLEVPVRMREREHGSSSITVLQSAYYVVKVMLALLVGIFRRRVLPCGGKRCDATPRLDRRVDRVDPADPRRARADPLAAAARALRAALARDGRRPASC